MYGPSHQGMQSLGAPSNARMNNNSYVNRNSCKRSIIKFILYNFLIDGPYMQEEIDRLANDMQNCSLTCNEGANAIEQMPNALNSVQNGKQSKQGLKNSNGKDSSYQSQQKGKQIVKGNNSKI